MSLLSDLQACFHGRKVFITGHTGFKGSWLTLWLIQLGAKVSGYALAPQVESASSLFHELHVENEIDHHIGNICNREELEKALIRQQPDMVIHLAAQALVREGYRDPVGTFNTNAMGTLYLLEALRKVPCCKAALFVTTDKVYDMAYSQQPHVEESPLRGDDPYSSSKVCAEQMVHAYGCSQFLGACACATARAGNVIGGGDRAPNRLIPDLIRAMESKERLSIRYPAAVRPWQYVLEPLMGYLKLLVRLFYEPHSGVGAWNLGPPEKEAISVEALLQKANRLLKSPVDIVYEASEIHEAPILRLNASKAEQYLDWKSCLSVDEALVWTLDWYKRVAQGENARMLTEQQIERYMGCVITRAHGI